MKRRLSAVLLALGLSVSALSMGVYAEETETETAATEQVTEATTEAEADEDLAEIESEVAEIESETEALSQEDQMKETMAQYLTEISAYTDDQLNQMLESDDASTQLIASNWNSVKDEIGNFVEITGLETGMSEDGSVFTITCDAKYDKVDDKTGVVVTYEVDQKNQTVSFEWEVNYTLGKLMQRAGMNTVMGIGIVFLTLLFLSWLIGKLHYIPDMIEKNAKKNEPAAPAPAPVPVAAPVVEEEDLTDDLELVAVITAAIAASENTSSDGFVVRSIKKANKRNWQRA